MISKLALSFCFFLVCSIANGQQPDWLIHPLKEKAAIGLSADGKDLVLQNGLLRRTFRLGVAPVCYDYCNLSNCQQLIRSVKPEAKLILNEKAYSIGGLTGQKENAYFLPEWLGQLAADTSGFIFVKYLVSDLEPLLRWKNNGWWNGGGRAGTGKTVCFYYRGTSPETWNLSVKIIYDLYDGLPLICKRVVIGNETGKPVRVNRVVNECLGIVEEESAVIGNRMLPFQGIYVESNYAFNNAMRSKSSDQTTHWKTDSTYTSQVNYNLETPCVLEVYPEKVSDIKLNAGDSLVSVSTYEMLLDSYDRDRRSLMVAKMYRAVAPWVTENPIFMHLVSKNDEEIKQAIDQCVATGYEALILSFGSNVDQEDTSSANLARCRALADLAHKKNLRIGGYSLFSSRQIDDADDVIDSATGKPGGALFGHAACYGSKWGLGYRDKIKRFYSATGFDIWENDGPYPGDLCASATHPGHEGLHDSQWRQMEIQKELYHWMNARGIYVNAPDWYFLDGTNKTGLGYREVNFSLPRDQQKILNRQNIFDGLWSELPSMAWGFVPLTRYQGGGPEAVLEPLSEHLADYEQLMIQYYGAGVQACYRGPRLYDNETTRRKVSDVVAWYKLHREVLNAEIIHLRRADGREWDGILHVNPAGTEKGFLMLYNPLKQPITRTIKVPLYYTGLTDKALFSEKGEKETTLTPDRDYMALLTVTIKPESYTWFVIR